MARIWLRTSSDEVGELANVVTLFRWRGFGFAELANVVTLFRWRGFVIRAICSVVIRAICPVLLLSKLFVHFFCLPKRNEPKKRAASNLFWDCHFVGCPRNTTRFTSLRSVPLKQYCLLRAIHFAASKMSLFFQKRFGGIARLPIAIGTAIWF